METYPISTPDVTVLRPNGRIDSHTTPTFRRQLEEISTAKTTNVVLNLADISFVDSSGLAALVYGMKRCRERGGDLYLCCPQQPVRMVLQLTRLDKAMDIFLEEADAIASFTN